MSATKSGGTGTPEHEDAVPESRGEAGGPASQGEGAVPESRGEDAVLESRGEAGVPASQGEGAVPESREEVGVPESQGDGDAGAPASRGRLPRAASALRWIAAVAVLAVAGTATAYGITRLDREDVPGLPAEADGLWEFPPLTAAPLPSDSPAPFADEDDPGVHHADPRALVLPAPEGAVEDRALRGRDGWSATDDFLSEYAEPDRATLGQLLVDTGLRHITARGWTTGDGTRTRVYLLRFGTAAVVDDLFHQHMARRATPPATECAGRNGPSRTRTSPTSPASRRSAAPCTTSRGRTAPSTSGRPTCPPVTSSPWCSSPARARWPPCPSPRQWPSRAASWPDPARGTSFGPCSSSLCPDRDHLPHNSGC
ncbi:hypothetical protein [Streptomyces sp. SAI-149]|uniref:hypothetical protein n=1 Tax=Streptomyces sp. SAI-149 TaxID=2940542 RepID=UPI00247CAD71|nr:hypothetical protein [Streptomyces sp. SAI-149]